jgi:hypothetical protein
LAGAEYLKNMEEYIFQNSKKRRVEKRELKRGNLGKKMSKIR